MHGLLLRCLVTLHQALWLVPPCKWDTAICEVFAVLCHQLGVAGLAVREIGAMHSALTPEVPANETLAETGGGVSTSLRSAASTSPRGTGGGSQRGRSAIDAWSLPCEQQAALLDAWHESEMFRGVDTAALRVAAALMPKTFEEGADEDVNTPPLLALACEAPRDAWDRVNALAEHQANLERSEREPRQNDATAIDDDESALPLPPPPEPEFALRHACRVARIALTRKFRRVTETH